ncbi:MAG: class I SAM-dependent methyltransferase [Reichenbachiella sp.]
MNSEKDAIYYDDKFSSTDKYNCDYKDSYYWVHWTQVMKFLGKNKDQNILEIGCGTGQLTEYLIDEGFHNYSGFDFSTRAVALAKERLPKSTFYVGNALDEKSFERKYETAICLEVLEHVDRDKDVLRNITIGKTVILSVPNFWVPSHVRIFNSERAIKKRYYKLINIHSIVRVGNIYIVKGDRSDFKPNFLQAFFKSRENVTISSFLKRIKHRLEKF